MPNNKKKNSRAAAAKKKVPEEAAQPPAVVPKKQALSQAQLSALIFLSLGLSYVIDYSSAVAEGNDTKACTTYFSGGVGSCSPADVLVIKIKYYVVVSCTLLVISAMLLCWTNESLFQSLITCLCISPIGTTIIAVQTSRGVLRKGRVLKLLMTATVLLAMAMSSIVKADLARPVTSRLSSLQHVCLLALALLSAWEAVGFVKDGVEGYLDVNPDDVSKGTNTILKFLAVDKITVSFLMMFALFFFDENRKRAMLFLAALSRVGELLFQLPKIESDLLDAEGVRRTLIGTAVFAGVAAFVPSFTKWKKH